GIDRTMGNVRVQDVQTNWPSAIVPLFLADEVTFTRNGEPHSVHANHSVNLGSIFLRSLPASISSAPRPWARQPRRQPILQCVPPTPPHSARRSRARKTVAAAHGGCVRLMMFVVRDYKELSPVPGNAPP